MTMILSSSCRRLLVNSTRSASRRWPASSSSSRRCFVSLIAQQVNQQVNLANVEQPRYLLTTKQQQRWLSSDLPYHIVVGMPALSPTMTSGTISKWNVSAGQSFSAGDSLAVIETDKATIDFEAQDDGVVAKLLVSEGGGELNVGVPIMVTVEDAGDVAAFDNFIPDASSGGDGAAPAADAAATTISQAAAPSTAAKDLPYHIIVGMPALSPTMDSGSISKWNVSEGQSFSAGDSLAVIETDKATIDFEAQDDGVVGKILKSAGSGEVKVGVPIMVVVEDAADVVAFQDFVAGSAPDSSATEASGPPPAPAALAEEVKKAVAPVVAGAPPTPMAAPAPAAPVTAAPVAPTSIAERAIVSLGGSSWGRLAAERSPLARALASKQKEYIKKYGSTGHIPIV